MSDYEYYCPGCEATVGKWDFIAPPDYYRCYDCGLATPFIRLPRRSILGHFVSVIPLRSIYLLESGPPFGYQLEDGSGVILLEQQ